MALCINTYLDKQGSYRVVDLGSRCWPRQTSTHRDLLEDYDCEYVGVDIKPGYNVDLVMQEPYRLPLRTNSADVVLSGQAFEHIPFPWVTMLEIARVLRPGGHAFITAPSRGHTHDVYDCWRYYPDSFRALAAFSRLSLLEAHTDFPPLAAGLRFDYAAISPQHYWGDSVGVFCKPEKYPERKARLPRELLIRWANRVANLHRVPLPPMRPERAQLDGPRPSAPL